MDPNPYNVNTSEIRVHQSCGRWEVTLGSQTMNLCHTSRQAYQAARDLHLTMWPDDDPAQLDRWYPFSR